MRQVVLDTETTGLSAAFGHRVIEIGCLELVNRKLTGRSFHTYLNPERDIDEGAFNVHGISRSFLEDKPVFSQIVDEFILFVEGAELIIHNAPFDVAFLNAELTRSNQANVVTTYCQILDTLVLAKQKHPGQKNNLDALCKRYAVNHSNRTLHGALLDAELLAQVYLAMTGGQINLFEDEGRDEKKLMAMIDTSSEERKRLPLVYGVTEEETEAHEAFMSWLAKKKK
jgi:DNA polymerase-3 subunit epsilon